MIFVRDISSAESAVFENFEELWKMYFSSANSTNFAEIWGKKSPIFLHKKFEIFEKKKKENTNHHYCENI